MIRQEGSGKTQADLQEAARFVGSQLRRLAAHERAGGLERGERAGEVFINDLLRSPFVRDDPDGLFGLVCSDPAAAQGLLRAVQRACIRQLYGMSPLK